MFKTIIAYRLSPNGGSALESAQKLEAALELSRFVACAPSQEESIGWVEPRGETNGQLVEQVGGQIVVRMKSEHRSVPGSAIAQELELHLDKIEEETGRRLTGKTKKDLKEEVRHSLLVRAFSKFGLTTVWIDPATHLLVAGVGSVKKGDEVIKALAIALDRVGEPPLQAQLVATKESPASVMAHWLREQVAPNGFSIDRDCELKDNEGSAAVRYSEHSLDITEIGEHIRHGKAPTRVAMTWGGSLSFMLTDALVIKKIKLLDVALEDKGSNAQGANGDVDAFDADVAIVTGVLAKMLPELFEALGGESEEQEPQGQDGKVSGAGPAGEGPEGHGADHESSVAANAESATV